VLVSEYVLCVSRLWIVVSYVSYVFLIPLLEMSMGLSDVRQFTRVAGECVNSTFIVFLYVVLWFWFCELLYCVCASECNAYVRVFEEVGYLSYSWTVIGENCPFFVFVCFIVPCFVCFLLCLWF